MKKRTFFKKSVSFAVALAMILGCLGIVSFAVEQQPQVVKKYYVNTDFETGTEDQWDGWVVRDDATYAEGNTGFVSEADNSYASFKQTNSNGWMITKTLDAPMNGKVTFEADVNTGTATHKTSRSLFTISQKGSEGQIALLMTSYGYFLSPKVSASQNQVKLFPLDKGGEWVHVKIELDFATGEIAYYFNDGGKVTVSGDGTGAVVPTSIAGDTFKTTYAYDTIKMYGSPGAELTTGVDNIQIYYEEIKLPPEPEAPRSYYINTEFTGTGEDAWDVWTLRDNADYPKANAEIIENDGDPYASFHSTADGGWFISAESPRIFTGEVTFETRVRYSGMGLAAEYNRNLFAISDSDDGQIALINNSKSGFFKTALSIGGPAATNSQLLKRIAEDVWCTLKTTVNFDTGSVRYNVDGVDITADGNTGAPLETDLKKMAGNFDTSKPYHTVKLYMPKGVESTTDVDYIKVYKSPVPCEGNAYLITTNEEDETVRQRLFNLVPGEIQGVATITNTEESAIQPAVLMGLYKDGVLIGVDYVQTESEIQPGDIQEVACNLTLHLEEGESIAPYELKLFVLRSLDSMEPIAETPLCLQPDCADEGIV